MSKSFENKLHQSCMKRKKTQNQFSRGLKNCIIHSIDLFPLLFIDMSVKSKSWSEKKDLLKNTNQNILG